MATLPYPHAAPPAASVSGSHPEVFRASAAFPLPPLHPVADFVALPTAKRYVTVRAKFALAAGAAGLWLLLAAVGAGFAVPATDAAGPWPVAALLFVLLVAVPGAWCTFALAGLVLDRPPTPAVARPALPVTVAITARNQPRSVVETLEGLRTQDYDGAITFLLVDNGSSDTTLDEATRAAGRLGIPLRIVVERKPGEAQARNAAAVCTDTPLLVVVRAGVRLHPSAVRLLVARLLRSPADTAAVSARALVRNGRGGRLGETLAYGYSVSTHADQRLQGLFQGPLVADGACALFRTDAVRTVGGWTRDDHDGVLITWRFLERGWRVFHESLAVGFATEDVSLGSWAARRVRAANAIVEGARLKGLRTLRYPYNRFVAMVDATGPLVDGLFTGAALLALALAIMGSPALVTAYVVLVLPVSVAYVVAARRVARHALDDVGLRAPGGPSAWLGGALGLHPVQATLGAANALAQVFGRMD